VLLVYCFLVEARVFSVWQLTNVG